jgi:hypothetical protein
MTTISDYAPKTVDPLKIAKITIKAVDQIGEHAATEIDAAATQIRAGAEEVAGKLEQLAEAIREHSRIASEHTACFVGKATQVLETVRALDAGLRQKNGETNGRDHEGRPSPADNSGSLQTPPLQSRDVLHTPSIGEN